MISYLLTHNSICEECDHIFIYLQQTDAEKERARLQKIHDDELAAKGYPQQDGNYNTIYFIDEVTILE